MGATADPPPSLEKEEELDMTVDPPPSSSPEQGSAEAIAVAL